MVDACEVCRGACCETILLPQRIWREFDAEWIAVRGRKVKLWNEWVELPSRCPQLTPGGACAIYTDRPQQCRRFEVGSTACRFAIARRRSAEWAAEIEALLPKVVVTISSSEDAPPRSGEGGLPDPA